MLQIKYVITCVVCVMIAGFQVQAKDFVSDLVCEYRTNPVGIDVRVPRLSWKLISEENNVEQTAYEIRVASSVKELKQPAKLLWNSGKVEGNKSVNISYGGPGLKSGQRVFWQVRVWNNRGKVTPWSEPAFWEMGILNSYEWNASWITREEEDSITLSLPAHYYRREFNIAKPVKSARLYVSALGLYQIFLNGQKVGDELFTPGWTSYNKRIQYQTYDVTSLIRAQNAIGAIVGDGWYRGFVGFRGERANFGDTLALIAQLHLKFTDGSSIVIGTDDAWKTSTGPIISSDIYNGENYDARLEMKGWTKPGFQDGNWVRAMLYQHPKNILVASQGLPVRVKEELVPVAHLTTPKGEMVFDFGQNMVGWVRIKLKGKKGQTITLKYAEVLDQNGNFYTENLRKAKATDTYTFAEDGEAIFEPHFTFHGFRYLKIEGLEQAPSLDDMRGRVIYSDMKPTGWFTCSDSLINRLQQNIQWGQKGNFLDIPTDCPQRDERLGWTGDAQVFAPTAAFNFNVAAFYTKWLKDLALDQLPNGVVPHVIPDVLRGRGGSSAWADAALIVPYVNYLVYGDVRILEEQYESMKKWVEYMRAQAGDDYVWTGGRHFGDWLAFASTRSDYQGATTDKDLIATAYFKYSSELLARIANILGKDEDAREYVDVAEKVKNAFVREFVTPMGRVMSNTQTAYCLALAFDVLPTELVPKAASFLAQDVRKMKHLTTGFVGTPLLCKTLSRFGYEKLAFNLLMRKEYPSWLYPVTRGATTIWERWDGIKPDGSFQNPGMNSFNHYAYGAIGEWLYTYVAGIKLDEKNPAYKHFYLEPHPGGGLTYAEATFESMYGKIVSNWSIEGDTFVYNVEIPANTTATVILPGNGEKKELGSGKYNFKVVL